MVYHTLSGHIQTIQNIIMHRIISNSSVNNGSKWNGFIRRSDITEWHYLLWSCYTGWSKKADTQFYFGDNFGNSAPILPILSLLQAEIYSA